MTPENKIIALEALRSGTFNQYRNGIANSTVPEDTPTSFCCIGVMDVAINGKLSTNFIDRAETQCSVQAIGIEETMLTEKGIEWLKENVAGLNENEYDTSTQVSSVLIGLNDTYRLDFKAIADFAEVAL